MRGHQPQQEGLFGVEALKTVDARAAELESRWNSAAERETTSRSRFAQRAIHPEEVAREVTAIRDALGRADEVSGFVRHALAALEAHVVEAGDGTGDFTAEVSGVPAGLRDALAPVAGAGAVESGRPIPFRTTAAVARGEAALVRTDPVVGAVAAHVLDTALDAEAAGRRPARRCGVVSTASVSVPTTLLLVRYRFHLTLPSRQGKRRIVAEDARLLAYQGSVRNPVWLPEAQALALLTAEAAENTDDYFQERTMRRTLGQLAAVEDHMAAYGDQLAEELHESHRRVRRASDEIVQGLKVTAQQPADILGVYVYLPPITAEGEAA